MAGNRNSGRKPIPASIKLLRGNPGKRPVPVEIEPDGAAVMPDEFKTKGFQIERRHWESIVPKLEQMGLATCMDQDVLEALCHWYAEWQRWRLGMHPAEAQCRNPLAEQRAAFKHWFDLAGHFGMTPQDRANLAGVQHKANAMKSVSQGYLA